MASVTLENLSKTYPGGQQAVRQFDLEIQDGEFLVVVGPSGCGKTTLLRLIAGLETVSSGTIKIGDRLVNDTPPQDRDIAMVFQDFALYPHLTVAENLAFPLKMRKTSQRDILRQVAWAANLLDLGDLLQRKPEALSGGERQRVALGRALVRRPSVFLLDEPLSSLDAQRRVQMRAFIRRLHRELQTTTLYVTHDQEEAMTLGDRVVVLAEGQLRQCGPPLEVYQRPADRLVARLLGMPPINLLAGTLEQNDGQLWFSSESGRLRLDEKPLAWLAGANQRPVVAGIRPESFVLCDAPLEHHSLAVTVSTTELLGSLMDVTLRTPDGAQLVCRTPSRALAEGQQLWAHVAPQDILLFETDRSNSGTIPYGHRLQA